MRQPTRTAQRSRPSRRRSAWMLSLAVACGAASVYAPAPLLAQTVTPEVAAAQTLNTARKAYNDKAYPLATEKFREFLKIYGGHRDAASAQYGLALCVLEGPEKDYTNALAALQAASNSMPPAAPERPFVAYYTGYARRALGNAELAKAAANPGEAPQRKAAAAAHFEEAAKQFSAAISAFVKAAPPVDPEWPARARCDSAEVLLQLDKAKEAGDILKPLVDDHESAKSAYRELALYYAGDAAFLLKDYTTAGRDLGPLAPFAQPFGVHARYLLARTHHLAGQRPEAEALYKSVITGYEEQKKAAATALANPAALKPEQLAFDQALVNSPAPDYVTRAAFYQGVLLFEQNHFDEAAARFQPIAQQTKLPLAPEAQLRLGFCYVQMRKFPEATATLTPLASNPLYADQAYLWLGRAQTGVAETTLAAALLAANPPGQPPNAAAIAAAHNAFAQSMAQVAAADAKAAEAANQLAGKLSGKPDESAVKLRRADTLLETGDAQQAARQFKDAAASYAKVVAENVAPDRTEQALQREAAALNQAGQYADSDAICQKFVAQYPASTLMASVLFRSAENAYLTATAIADKKDSTQQAQRDASAKPQFEEAVKRYGKVIEKYPEFAHVNVARQGLGTSLYRLGRYAEAAAILETIPDADRTAGLATVPYLQADCLIRQLAPEAPDALEANRLAGAAGDAAKLLETFVANNAASPQAPDALLKLGHCYGRMGAMTIAAAIRKQELTQAKTAYEKLLTAFPASPAVAQGLFEHAKIMALLGDPNTAAAELAKVTSSYAASPVAPLAVLRLSSLYRSMGKAADADKMLTAYRPTAEATLAKDPARIDLIPQLQYEHALAMREAGKLTEAQAAFEAIATKFAGKPEAVNAAWRVGQCKREAATAQLAAALTAYHKVADDPSTKPEQTTAALAAITKPVALLKEAGTYFQAQADEAGKKSPGSDAQQHLLYELAWCQRGLADAEAVDAARKMQQESLAAAKSRTAGDVAPPTPPAALAPQFAPSAVPPQPSELLARETYRKLVAAAPQSALSVDARMELADLLSARGDQDGAVALLTEAWEQDPPADASDRVKLQMGCCYLAKGDAKSALAVAESVLRNPATKLVAEASYLRGEALVQQQMYAQAIEQLIPFRDKDTLKALPGVSDRALLRLGEAYAGVGNWDASRQAMEAVVSRFPQSPWLDGARYGIGWAYQMQKQYDTAVNAYGEVIKRTVAEPAAKAQVQIGLCRLEQNRPAEAAKALLVVPFTYDYPELSASAWCEAGRAYAALKQPAEAAKLYQRVVKDHPASRWAQVAQERLASLK